MPTHIINKQLFDFTYTSETVALTMQKQLQDYTCNQVNVMLGQILDEAFNGDENYIFDKLEIDLGALDLQQLETEELYSRLKTGLIEQLQKLKHESPAPLHHSNAAFTVTQNFLTNGDVPWWLDKAGNIPLDEWLEKLLVNDKNALVKIIENAASPETVVHRIFKYYQLNQPGKIQELLHNPAVINVLQNNRGGTKKAVSYLLGNENNISGIHDNNATTDQNKQTDNFVPEYNSAKHAERDIIKTSLLKPGNISVQWRQLNDDKLQALQDALSQQSEFEKEPVINRLINQLQVKSFAEWERLLQTLVTLNQPEIAAVLQVLLSRENITAPVVNSNKNHHYLKNLSVYQLQWLLALVKDDGNENSQLIISKLISDTNQTSADAGKFPDNAAENGSINRLPGGDTFEQNPPPNPINNATSGLNHLPIAKAFETPEKQVFDKATTIAQNTVAEIIKEHNAKYSPAETAKKEKAIVYISNKLSSVNINLRELLNQMPSTFVFDLETKFRQLEKSDSTLRKMIRTILLHSYFFQYNLLALLMEWGDEKTEAGFSNETFAPAKTKDKKEAALNYIHNKIAPAQQQLLAHVDKLTINETAILKDVLAKKSAASVTEKKLLQKLMASLPQEAITFLHFFTQLEEAEIQKLVKPKKPEPGLLFFSTNEDEQTGNKIHITNAGLCLLAPYLPAFFRNLHLLEVNQFKSTIAAQKGVYLLQYMTDGSKKFPEYLLQLNKILCGFAVTDPMFGKVHLTKKDRAEADSLLEAIINNWKALKNTSIQGLQDSFLQRKGILTEQEKSWTLQVEKKGYDMLIDTLPWGFNMIKFPWMKKHMVTEW